LLNRTCWALIGLVGALIITSGVARAQNDLDEKARAHFEAGSSYYEEGDYEQAMREFQRAYDLSKRPTLQYNISLTYEKLGDLANAVGSLEKYLNQEKKIANRSTLELRLENLRKRLERQQKGETEPSAEAGAALTPVEGVSGTAANQKPIANAPGSAASPAATQKSSTTPAETQPAASNASASTTAKPSTKLKLSTGVWASYITAGVGAVTYIIFGSLAIVENGKLSDKCLPGRTCSKDQVSNLRTYCLVADIGLGVALAAGALGTVLLLTSGKKEEKVVAVAPWVSPTELGAISQVRF
jgi:tetratricopeptide (TPR) repeat protein